MSTTAELSRERLLRGLYRACWNVAARYNPDSHESPLWGKCVLVSLIVRGCFGGDLISGDYAGLSHYWNRLPDGTEVDLTSCQFGGNGFDPVVRCGKVVENADDFVFDCMMAVDFGKEVLEELRQ